MPEGNAEAKDAWVAAVLGVAAGTGVAPGKLLPIWTAAKDRADGQLEAMRRALRDSGDPVGVALADRGLPAFTHNTLVPMLTALIEADAATGEKAAVARKSAARSADDLRNTLVGHHGLATLADNPYGVEVDLVATLVPALERITRLCEAGA